MADLVRGTIYPASPLPCESCPWRTANQGKRHAGHWYTTANLKRLWAGLRRGVSMSCHPTDPRNPLPPDCAPLPEGVKTHECTGALILQQREFMVYQDGFRRDVAAYRTARPLGMTLAGLRAIVERQVLGGVPLIGCVKMSHPDLGQEGVGHSPLDGWKQLLEARDG